MPRLSAETELRFLLIRQIAVRHRKLNIFIAVHAVISGSVGIMIDFFDLAAVFIVETLIIVNQASAFEELSPYPVSRITRSFSS